MLLRMHYILREGEKEEGGWPGRWKALGEWYELQASDPKRESRHKA